MKIASFEWFMAPDGDTWHRWHQEHAEFTFACGEPIPINVPMKIRWNVSPDSDLCEDCLQITDIDVRRLKADRGVCVITEVKH